MLLLEYIFCDLLIIRDAQSGRSKNLAKFLRESWTGELVRIYNYARVPTAATHLDIPKKLNSSHDSSWSAHQPLWSLDDDLLVKCNCIPPHLWLKLGLKKGHNFFISAITSDCNTKKNRVELPEKKRYSVFDQKMNVSICNSWKWWNFFNTFFVTLKVGIKSYCAYRWMNADFWKSSPNGEKSVWF